MGWDDSDNDNKKGRRNPWGGPSPQRPQGGPPRGPSNNDTPPDLDQMLKNFQNNMNGLLPGGMGGGKFALLALTGLAALWLASGLFIVSPGEHAVVQRFGAWERTRVNEGLGYHLPYPIETVTKVQVNELRNMTIGFVGAATRGNVSTRRDIPEESLMLTADRNIVDLDLTIQWNIKSAEDFLFRVQDQEATIKKVAESAIREAVGQTPMFSTLTTGRADVAAKTTTILQENLDEYHSGVHITGVLIQSAEVHPDVQAAFQDVQSAKQDAEDVQNQAQAYREDIIPRARGNAIQLVQQAQAYREAAIARAQGDASRFNAIYESYLSGQDVTKQRMYIETMEDVLKNAQKIIIGDQGNQGVVPYLPLNELNRQTKQETQQ
jgi:membrane protease subunit HflK